MQIDEYIDLFEQIEVNLTNPRIQQVLNEENFDYDHFKHVIQKYIEYADIVYQSEGSKLFNTVIEKAKEILQYTENSSFVNRVHNFINAALYLSKHAPNDQILTDNDRIDTLISEEEFSSRYDNLIDSLNFEGEESNLILETEYEQVPFKLLKTKNRTIAILTRKGSTNKVTKDKLINIVYHNGSKKNLSYEPVIIAKILDNSIFDYITTSSHNNNLTEALNNQLNKQKEELLILRDKLENLEKNEEQLISKKEQINQMFSLAKNARNEYEDAKDAAINDTKLKTSVSYWEEKQVKHFRRFWRYGILAIVLIVLLVVSLYMIISNHNTNAQKNINNISKVIEISASKKEKNVTNHAVLKADIKDSNQTVEKISLDNPIDYLNYFGLYALLIFTSSSVLWVIRITVKIALSNLHLSEDAHERVVMIKTYLAFISEGHGLEENDKQLILTSLFRPSNIGIIKDESSITVADIVSSLKAK